MDQRISEEQNKKAVAWAHQQFDQMKSARQAIERQWYMNLAFYFGKQNVAFRTGTGNVIYGTGGVLRVPQAPPWRHRFVINRIRSIIRTEVTKLTSQKPTAYVIPASSEELDMQAAQAGEQLWESLYRNKRLKQTIRRAVFWSQTCGTSFLKTYWDPTAEDPSAEKSVVDPIVQNVMQRLMPGMPLPNDRPSGDIKYCHETPFHILVPDLREEEIEYQPWIIHAQVRNKDQLQMTFPSANLGAGVKQELIDPSFINLVGAKDTQTQDKGILVLEIWVKPGATQMFPQGGMFTIAGEEILQGVNGWPYQHKEYPFSKIDHIPSGKFYADSTIVDLIPIQKEYNRTRSQIIEAKNSASKPQLLAERGSIVASKITSEPGIVIFYEAGFNAPNWITPPQLPAHVSQELDRMIQDFEDISGQHEVTQGQAPPGVTAATAISYLQEQDESKLSHTFDSVEEAIEKMAQQTLSIVHQYWSEERTVKITGTDGSWDVKAFKGADLRNNFDIRVEGGSALPVSRAAKQAFILDLMKMGFIDPNKGLEVMEIGGIGKIYESIQVDVRQAQRENQKMAKVTAEMLAEYEQNAQMEAMQQQGMGDPAAETGDPMSGGMVDQPQPNPAMMTPGGEPLAPPPIVPVNTWDEHRIHIEIHNKYRKSQSFESLELETKQVFEDHVRDHVAALMETMAAEQQAEAEGGGDNPELGKMTKESSEPERSGDMGV